MRWIWKWDGVEYHRQFLCRVEIGGFLARWCLVPCPFQCRSWSPMCKQSLFLHTSCKRIEGDTKRNHTEQPGGAWANLKYKEDLSQRTRIRFKHKKTLVHRRVRCWVGLLLRPVKHVTWKGYGSHGFFYVTFHGAILLKRCYKLQLSHARHALAFEHCKRVVISEWSKIMPNAPIQKIICCLIRLLQDATVKRKMKKKRAYQM